MIKITIIAPAYNEEGCINEFYKRTKNVLTSLPDVRWSFLFVVDPSTDKTYEILEEIARLDPLVRVIVLSRRFGHQMSLLAGIENAFDDDAFIMMDCDLQHPPELILKLFKEFTNGHDVIYTIRGDTMGLSQARKNIGNIFYSTLNFFSDIKIPANSADFRLISKRVRYALISDFKERDLFLRGIFSWIGFSQIAIPYVAEERFSGQTKFNVRSMFNMGINGIISFSTKPLRVSMYLGGIFALLAFVLASYLIARFFINSDVPNGWTTIVVLLLFFSAIQLIVLGILGAYIASIYDETKNRPRYIIDKFINK
jgi:dolichol-phosphate mannosyltransferase